PAIARYGHNSREVSSIWLKCGIPECASAGGVHLLSHNSGSVRAYRYSRSPAATLTAPGAPEKKFNVRSRSVNGTADPSSAVTFTSAGLAELSITSFTAPTLPPEIS